MDTVNLTTFRVTDSGQRGGSVAPVQDPTAKAAGTAGHQGGKAVQNVTRLDAAQAGRMTETEDKGADDEKAREALEEAVSNLNDYVQQQERNLQFSVDEVTGRSIVKVVDAQTEEVIRQFPPEEVLNMARFLREKSAEESGLILRTEA